MFYIPSFQNASDLMGAESKHVGCGACSGAAGRGVLGSEPEAPSLLLRKGREAGSALPGRAQGRTPARHEAPEWVGQCLYDGGAVPWGEE